MITRGEEKGRRPAGTAERERDSDEEEDFSLSSIQSLAKSASSLKKFRARTTSAIFGTDPVRVCHPMYSTVQSLAKSASSPFA
jgi:hypothetical protein